VIDEIFLPLLFISLITALVLAKHSLKVVGRNQSLVIFQNGQAIKVVGGINANKPTRARQIALILPFIQSAKLVDISNRCRAIPLFFDVSSNQTPVVLGTFEFEVNEPSKAVSNDDLQKSIEHVLAHALKRVLEDATIVQCLTEKSLIAARALEIANLRCAAWGVAMTSLKIDSFPRHRQLLFQIATMPYIVYWQIVEETQ
jgi:regulator of protease activity HflC (stomatin/prohibitin superfamily)